MIILKKKPEILAFYINNFEELHILNNEEMYDLKIIDDDINFININKSFCEDKEKEIDSVDYNEESDYDEDD